MTQRTYSELVALFPDNTSGAISPQDIRDFLESVRTVHGSLNLVTPAATTINVAGTYELINGVMVSGTHNALMTADASGRLTYNGASERHFHIVASISMTSQNNNQTVGFRIARNGVSDPVTQIRRRVGTGSDVGAVAIHGDEVLSNGDYIEVFATNYTSTGSLTVEDFYFFAMGML